MVMYFAVYACLHKLLVKSNQNHSAICNINTVFVYISVDSIDIRCTEYPEFKEDFRQIVKAGWLEKTPPKGWEKTESQISLAAAWWNLLPGFLYIWIVCIFYKYIIHVLIFSAGGFTSGDGCSWIQNIWDIFNPLR